MSTTTNTIHISEQDTLVIKELVANIEILSTPEPKVEIRLEGTDEQLSDVLIEIANSRVVISAKQKVPSHGSVTNVFSGNYYGPGSSISIGNITICDTSINNVCIGEVNYQDEPPVRVTIYMPKYWNLKASISEGSSLESKIPFGSVKLSISGSSKVNLEETKDVQVNASGGSKIEIGSVNGNLLIKSSGSSRVSARGAFTNVNLTCSAGSNVKTFGICYGNYYVKSNGGARINHSGKVEGQIKKRTSGGSSVKISEIEVI